MSQESEVHDNANEDADDDILVAVDEVAPVRFDASEFDKAITAEMPPLSDKVVSLSKSHRLDEHSLYQRVVYALTARTLNRFHVSTLELVVSLCLIPFALAMGAALGLAVVAALGWSLSLIGLADVLVGVLLVVVIILSRSFKDLARDRSIGAKWEAGRMDSIDLGRLDNIFESVGPVVPAALLGAFFGMQHALLIFTPSHFGLDIEGTFSQSFFLTLDNACHGLFLDILELHDIYWGKELKHTTYSANVFMAFRLAIDATAFLMGILIWRRYRMRQMLKGLPSNDRDVDALLKWIDSCCGDGHRWPRQYHDEFVFLLLAKEFIAGEFQLVRKVSRAFRNLNVDAELRTLFRTPDGASVFCREKDDLAS